MANFEKDLAQYESPLGVVSGDTLRLWMNEVPEFNDLYTDFITNPIKYKGRYVPAGYVGKGGNATPVKNQIISLIVALAKNKFEHRYSLQETLDLLKLSGVQLSKAGLIKVLPRIADSINVTHLIPRKGRMVKITNLDDAEALVKRERKAFAKKAKKDGLTGDAVKEALHKKRETTQGPIPKQEPKQDLNIEEDDAFAGREVIYEPTAKQILFHAASEKIVLYGGAAGGGKSYALIFDAIRYAHVPRYRAVIIRRTMPELTELIETSKEFYPKLFPGAKYNTQKTTWRFPSGASVEFGYLDKPNDKLRYQGQQFQYIAFDELGQWNDSEGWNYLKSRLRKPPIDPLTGKPILCLMRATSNPGAAWVKEMFIDAAPENTTFYDKAGVAHRFIPATLLDNPHLDADYRQMLESLPEMEKRQLLYGDWNATDSAAFPEFRPDGTYNIDEKGTQTLVCEPHVVEPFEIPKWWNRVCGMDYGYRDPASAIWYAVHPDTGQKIVYKEYCKSERTGTEFGLDCKALEADEIIPIDHVLDWAAFNRTGSSGPTVGEEIRLASGFGLRPADKNRIAGKVQVHSNLRPMPNSTKPGIVFFSNCTNIITQLKAAQIKPNDPDDIDQTRIGEDHKHHWDAYDALRYGLMARPTRVNRAEAFRHVKQQSRWNQVERYFS